MNNPFTLKEKTILVTGASSGLGISIACEISKMGANVILTGRNPERLKKTFELLEGNNNKQIIADLCDINQINKLTEEIPCIDGIVFCAGVIKTMPVKNISDSDMEEIFHTNIMSSIQISSKLLKKKKINKGGSIVFISSVSSKVLAKRGL